MTLSYDTVEMVFLSKITEYEFLKLAEDTRTEIVDGYLKRAVAGFKKVCNYDLTKQDDEAREFTADFSAEDVDEVADVLAEGMVVQWMKPYVYKQELLESVINTNDFTTYSPAEILLRVGNAYTKAQTDFIQAVREYSYNHGDLTRLHL